MTLAVAEKTAAEKPKCELGDIFREYGDNYRRTHTVPSQHRKVMRAIERCRTAKLGGHLDQCDSCGYQHPAYNSCRDRHCPKCQSLTKAQWVEKQKAELLPTGAFHLMFSLPHELNPLILCNQRPLLELLFKAVSQTLMEFSHTHLHGTPGFTLVLHTWDQQLKSHFHLHCLFPAYSGPIRPPFRSMSATQSGVSRPPLRAIRPPLEEGV